MRRCRVLLLCPIRSGRICAYVCACTRARARALALCAWAWAACTKSMPADLRQPLSSTLFSLLSPARGGRRRTACRVSRSPLPPALPCRLPSICQVHFRFALFFFPRGARVPVCGAVCAGRGALPRVRRLSRLAAPRTVVSLLCRPPKQTAKSAVPACFQHRHIGEWFRRVHGSSSSRSGSVREPWVALAGFRCPAPCALRPPSVCLGHALYPYPLPPATPGGRCFLRGFFGLALCRSLSDIRASRRRALDARLGAASHTSIIATIMGRSGCNASDGHFAGPSPRIPARRITYTTTRDGFPG